MALSTLFPASQSCRPPAMIPPTSFGGDIGNVTYGIFSHHYSKEIGMKLLFGTVAMVSGVLFAVSMASANPALLPKHEGYPMKNSGSPVTGQPTANDPGQ